MAVKPSKEATAKEVFAHVTLLDLVRSFKTLAISLASIGTFSLIALGVGKASSPFLPDWNVPEAAWVSLSAIVLLFIMLSERSYHETQWAAWFPKLGCVGAIICGVYIGAVFWVYQQTSWWIAYFFLIPIFWFIELAQLGHSRLMAEREKT